MIFKRKIYKKLIEWKNEWNGKTALLIEGARRIGKSTIAEEFAKNEYDSYILIDFAQAEKEVIELFDNIRDLDYIFLKLQQLYNVSLKERNSLIIFDEVQFCPKARQAIKYLVKDGRYDYLETGSLISIKKNVKDILIPSEEIKINMYPLDYEEFLDAIGDNTSYELLKQFYSSKKPFNESLRKLLRDFRIYMLVGGMPQAVNAYIETNDFRHVDLIKRNILKLYEDDLFKIDNTGKLTALFKAIPAQLQKNDSRYHISSVINNARSQDYLERISELENSKTVLISHHVNDPNTSLTNTMDLEKFKLYLNDTGLFVTLMFEDKDFTENIIYTKLLSNKLNVNLGYLYENVVAQELKANGKELFYNTFKNINAQKMREIDFLISKGNKICPIEVKSSSYKTHISLDEFCSKYSDRILEKYILYTKDIFKEQDVFYLPIFLTSLILD